MGTYTHLIWVGVVVGFIALMVRILNKKPQKPKTPEQSNPSADDQAKR
jgi:heme exporter protein D